MLLRHGPQIRDLRIIQIPFTELWFNSSGKKNLEKRRWRSNVFKEWYKIQDKELSVSHDNNECVTDGIYKIIEKTIN